MIYSQNGLIILLSSYLGLFRKKLTLTGQKGGLSYTAYADKSDPSSYSIYYLYNVSNIKCFFAMIEEEHGAKSEVH